MDHDREETCARCGAHHDDHYTAWENGIPIVGSYQDAPNGRVCSNLAEELKAAVLQVEGLKTVIAQDAKQIASHFDRANEAEKKLESIWTLHTNGSTNGHETCKICQILKSARR